MGRLCQRAAGADPGLFLLVPITTIVVVSFWDYDSIQVIPDFLLQNYQELLGAEVTWRIYLNTLRYTAIVWTLTLGIGFTVAYFLAFHIRTTAMPHGAVSCCARSRSGPRTSSA